MARKKGNASTGTLIAATLRANGMRVEQSIESDLLKAAELFEISKENPGPINSKTNFSAALSLGDAIILAVTERLNVPIVTRESYWNWLADQGLLRVKVQRL